MEAITGGAVRYIGPPLHTPFGAAAEASNGRVYAVPFFSGYVIEVDPSSGKVRTIGKAIGECRVTGRSYLSLVKASNGLLYAPPSQMRRVLEIDPVAETVRQIGPNLGEINWMCGHYVSIALAGNGRLYAPPAQPGRVLEIDPATGEVSFIGEEIGRTAEPGNHESNPWKALYGSIVLARNGCLYATPYYADHVLEIDPARRTVGTIGEPVQRSVPARYFCASLAANGRIYSAPNRASHMMEVDIEARTVRQVGEDLGTPGFGFAQVAMGEKIWSISASTLMEAKLLEFDPSCSSCTQLSIVGGQGALMCFSALSDLREDDPFVVLDARYMFRSSLVGAGNGRIYAFPSTKDSCILEIDSERRSARAVGEPVSGGYWQAVATRSGQVIALPHSSGQRIVLIDSLNLLREPHHSFQLPLQTALASGDYADVTVRTSADKTYQAHKLVLALRSRVFQKAFAADMREAREAVVELGDVSPSVSDMFMKYLYSGDADVQRISVEKLCELGALGHRFEVDDLVAGCASLLERNVGIRSATHILKYADQLQCADLKHACLDFIVANQEVMDTDEWEEVVKSPLLLREVTEALTGRRCKKRKLGDREFAADTDWTSLTWPKLRRACAERGLAQEGEKQSLIERLQA